MSWLILAFAGCFLVAYFFSARIFRKRMETGLQCHCEFSSDEVFAGEFLYLDQIVINTTDRTIPFLKMETLLPEGLKIVLDESEKKDEEVNSTESMWVLKAHCQVRRRWRIVAKKRGVYTTQQIQMHVVSLDILGLRSYSERLIPEVGSHSQVTVLPFGSEWITQIALSPSFSGERTVPHGLIHDPMTVCGIRVYENYDPLNTVDWKQTARLGYMVVRQTEVRQNDSFNLVLNMQSTLIEPRPPELSAPHYIEDCISICASLIDSAIRRNLPIRLFANTLPDGLPGSALRDDEIGSQIFCSEEFESGNHTLETYRMLAQIPLHMTIPIERMMDDILANPQLYVRGGNLVMVTTFLDRRMLDFHGMMKKMGINVIFFVITSYQNAMVIPSDVDVYFKPSKKVGGTGYAC